MYMCVYQSLPLKKRSRHILSSTCEQHFAIFDTCQESDLNFLKMLQILILLFGSAVALQCDIPGECVGDFLAFTSENSSTDFVMAIGGYRCIGGSCSYLDDVELVSLDPILQPLPECLNELNSIPQPLNGLAVAVDYSGESNYQLPSPQKKLYT